jgi:hypothetical protein
MVTISTQFLFSNRKKVEILYNNNYNNNDHSSFNKKNKSSVKILRIHKFNI